MEKLFKRSFQALDDIFHFIDEFISQNNLYRLPVYPIHLAVEEIFTNMVKYNNKSSKGISLELLIEENQLVLRLIDHNGNIFRPASIPPYDTSLPLEKRPVGKLGIHLVKKYMDDIRHEFANGLSIVTLKKNIRDTHV